MTRKDRRHPVRRLSDATVVGLLLGLVLPVPLVASTTGLARPAPGSTRPAHEGARWGPAAGAGDVVVPETGSSLPAMASASCDSLKNRGPWISIGAGEFDDASTSQDLIDFGVDPQDPDVIFVTNGWSIKRSRDGGCSWTTIFPNELATPEGLPTARVGLDRIHELEVARMGSALHIVVSISFPQPAGQSLPGPSKQLEVVPGYGVLISHDGGLTWSFSSRGLPMVIERFDALRLAPSDPNTAYLKVANASGVAALYASRDGGESWKLRSDVNEPGPDWSSAVLEVDPIDPRTVWLGGDALANSADGGVTWTGISFATAVRAIDVFHQAGSSPVVTVTSGTGVARSQDSGRSWSWSRDAPAGVSWVASGSSPDRYMLSDGPKAYLIGADAVISVFGPLRAKGQASSSEIATFRDPLVTTVDGERYWFISPERRTLEVFKPEIRRPGEAGRESHEEPPCGGADQPGEVPVANLAPPGTVVYVGDFATGCLVAFDRYGDGRGVAQGPVGMEGLAVDPLGRVVIAGRHTNELLRFDPTSGVLEVLDQSGSVYFEGPDFDAHGNLFVVSNIRDHKVLEYPWPQYPGQRPKVVWRRVEGFIEDVKVAPPASPYAGDVFVAYSNKRLIGHLRRTAEGWKGLETIPVPSDFNWLMGGMAFSNDGSLLLAEAGNHPLLSQHRILRFDPTLREVDVLATMSGGAMKIDVDDKGYIYVTRDSSGGEGLGVMRFAPDGQRMLPDFVDGLSNYPLGIAVPDANTLAFASGADIPKVPKLPAEALRAGPPLAPPMQQPPPPPPPVTPLNPAALPGPINMPANAPASQMQPGNAQAHAHAPQATLVTQRQEQPQMAFVHAVRQVKEQLGAQHSMVRTVQQRSDPLAAVKFGMAISALSMMLLYGFASATVRRAFVRHR